MAVGKMFIKTVDTRNVFNHNTKHTNRGKGEVMGKVIQGFGVNDGKYPSRKDGKHTKEYNLWQNMLLRCTEKYWGRCPTYIGATCSENFKSYTFFHEWCQEQIGVGNTDENGRNWQLDKDILTRGNKLYSEYVCVFVPQKINLLLTKNDASRGECPIGVSWHKRHNKFLASCSTGDGKRQHLGCYSTVEEAFLAYKTFKEVLIKLIANEYRYQIDARVYDALMKYEINEND